MTSEGYPVGVMQAYAGKERNEFTLMDFVETETPTVVRGKCAEIRFKILHEIFASSRSFMVQAAEYLVIDSLRAANAMAA